MLTGCAGTEAKAQEQLSAADTTAASTAVTQTETTLYTTRTTTNTVPVTDETETATSAAETEVRTEQPETECPETVPFETETSETETEPAPGLTSVEETFQGFLIDEDCSDFDDLPAHGLHCMLMETCRASGYGLDIQQPDGSWQYIPFDENGQNLTWEYVTHTTRTDNLYVTVKGTLTDGVIAVSVLEEVP